MRERDVRRGRISFDQIGEAHDPAGGDQLGQRPPRYPHERTDPQHRQAVSTVRRFVEPSQLVGEGSADPQDAADSSTVSNSGYSSSDPNTTSTMLISLLTSMSSPASTPSVWCAGTRTGLADTHGHWRNTSGHQRTQNGTSAFTRSKGGGPAPPRRVKPSGDATGGARPRSRADHRAAAPDERPADRRPPR